jgi:cytochrome c oxidase assembly protein subunit 15
VDAAELERGDRALRQNDRVASRRQRLIRLVREPLTPRSFALLSVVGLAALGVIVLSGAAVRLTGSGLGCPDWPKCYGHVFAPLQTHALIEYGNRLLSGFVGVVTVVIAIAAFRRRPFRRDLAILATLLPLGVVAQAVLGGLTVENKLAPGFVMAHFALSMLIVVAAAALAWCARNEPGSRQRTRDAVSVWAVRGLLPLGALTIFAGTAATAAGPHAGGNPGQKIVRLTFEGGGTYDWAIHRHAEIGLALVLAVLVVRTLVRRRGKSDPLLTRSLTVAAGLLVAQAVVGIVQYELKVPGELVWLHVSLATGIWIALLWATAAAGRLVARQSGARSSLARAPAAQ